MAEKLAHFQIENYSKSPITGDYRENAWVFWNQEVNAVMGSLKSFVGRCWSAIWTLPMIWPFICSCSAIQVIFYGLNLIFDMSLSTLFIKK